MTFEYMKHVEFQDSIDIEDIGNVVLELYNDEGQLWYLWIETKFGFTTVRQVGALAADSDMIQSGFSFVYFEMEYNDKKLTKIIEKFITDDHRAISQIFFTTADVVRQKLENLQGVQIYND